METSKKCKNCKYYRADVCHLPLWADGKHYDGQVTKAENTCELFEESDILMTMVEGEE